ncbi:aquaporin family protein [Thermaerobacter sp. PB12/4term]|uniref:MIP/aquaporin family protein n=1 Tax=Thermaerobacter sp. PB12/4term TaxID=2293838 RepID=UPI000E32C274|nr:MIP/aquaporin family protein [Thermaerobacter sp. PB12/4term]QIA27494.1 aquaporin family protein [Thermaerobacter sp. PB12/4term]
MSPFLGEVLGTAILILLGDGVVANVLLNRSKGQNSGWIVITTGWALAVTVAVYVVGHVSGAHINPAVTIGLAAIGQFDWAQVPSYIIAQMIGAFLGAVLVYVTYLPHWGITDDPELKLAVFSTGPAVRNPAANLVTEIIGTAALVLGVLGIGHPANNLAGGLSPLLVGFLVWSIGLSLGGPTGYAINPARDLGPRIAHAVLPIPGKGSSDWGYAWIPVVGPIIGGVLGAVLFQGLFG